MKLLWTKSKLQIKGQDFIGFFLKEPCSHFGIMFDNGKIMHWSFRGKIVQSEFEFLEHRELVFEIDYKISKYREKSLFDRLDYKYRGSTYDYVYLMWLVWRALLLNLSFGSIKIPYKEPFGETSNNMICHEALKALPKEIRPKYDVKKGNTPYRLYLELKKD